VSGVAVKVVSGDGWTMTSVSLGDVGDVIKVVVKLEGIAVEDLVKEDICVCSFVDQNERVMKFVVVMTITAVLGVISSIEAVKIMAIKV